MVRQYFFFHAHIVIVPALCLVLLGVFFPKPALAGKLYYASDRISSSAPSATTTSHTFTFTTGGAIPAGGSIIISFPSGAVIPGLLDYTDIDLATAATTSGPFTEHSLAGIATAVDDGVSVSTGSGGSILFTLAGLGALPASTTVRVKVGLNAVVGGAGDLSVISPSSPGAYPIWLETKDASSARIDLWNVAFALVTPVGMGGKVDTMPIPTRSNGLPSGLLPDTTTNVLLSLNTDIFSYCKYATSSGVDYFAMSSSTIFTSANFGTLHMTSVLTATNTIYSFYVRCANTQWKFNTDDYLITFEVGSAPGTTTPPEPPPPPAPSGPSGGGGGGGLFLTGGDVTLEGSALPFGNMVITQDGVIVKEEQLSVLGDFSRKFERLQRGTYLWGVYVKDPDGRRSSTYTSTIYLIARTNNIIAPIYISPTLSSATTTVPVGENIELRGYAIALKPVQVIMNRQGDFLYSKIITATTTANGNGSWSLALPTESLAKGTYEIKAQSLITSRVTSLNSPTIYVGIGEDPNPHFGNRSDLNKDGKVNLVDFSILLFNWKGTDAVADINQDGIVNLTDFSIMLSNWTG